MRYRASEDARQRVCWKSLEMGTPFLCYGDGCMAWESEPEENRKKRGDDITPLGYCGLYEAEVRDVD